MSIKKNRDLMFEQIKKLKEQLNESKKTNEGILDAFRKRKKAIKNNKYNPSNIGYDHPDFAKKFPGFSKNPEKEITDIFKEMDVTEKKIMPLLSELISNCEGAKEIMKQQDMVKGGNGNKFYINQLDKFINELQDVEFKVKKGIW